MPLQSKLLTVLQNRKINRLGEAKERPINVRVICATNMPLYEMVDGGKFRKDLMYRINTIEIIMPPLREREMDSALLANNFLKEYTKRYNKQINKFSDEALLSIQNHSWPGNIRELQHSIERAVILCEKNFISSSDLNIQTEYAKKQSKIGDNLNIKDIEKLLISKALDKHKGNITKTAKELGLTRAALYRRMEKFNL